MAQKRAYLNNRDLLKEIHTSKRSYCAFTDEDYFDYDFIVDDINRMSDARCREARKARAERLTQIAVQKMIAEEGISAKAGNKRADEVRVHTRNINLEDVVVREMTHEHVPQEENKSGKLVYPKLKFPPFKHFAYIDGKWTEVLRSHWEGGFDNGYFKQDQGRVTDKLAKMIMMLVERISHKGNYRGYSFINDMRSEALVHLSDVALKFDESKGDNPFAFYTTIINHSFKGFLNFEKKQRTIRDDLMIAGGYSPSHTAQVEHEMSIRLADIDEENEKAYQERQDKEMQNR